MITTYGHEIRRTDPHRHKYGSAMAEYLDMDVPMRCDDYSGDSESPTGHFARFGRRILCGDERGFVWVEEWPEEAGAKQVYEAMDAYYCVWADEELEENWPEERLRELGRLDGHLAYVAVCARENLTAFGYTQWLILGRPKGPLG